MDHRVEPPSWLPEGAAPAGSGPAPGDNGDSTVPAERPADKKGPATNGQDGTATYAYTYDTSYAESKGSTFGAGSHADEAAPGPFGEETAPAGSRAAEQGSSSSSPAAEAPAFAPGLAGGPAAAAPAAAGPAAATGNVSAGAGHSTGAFSTYGVSSRPKPVTVQQPRRANLVIARLEPWSVMKFSFLISLVAWIVLFVAVAILYYALSGLGVFDSLQRTLSSVTSSQASAGVDLSKWTSASRVLGYTMLIGAVNVVLITALSTVGAMIYNLVTHLGGGIEVTLRETD